MKHLAKTLMIALAALAAAAQAADPVPYLDPVAHTTNLCTAYTFYTDQTTLDSGWYVVSGDITNDTRIAVDGDVHLILADGASLTANEGVTVAVENNVTNSLTIWAQSDGAAMGALNATGGNGQAGIGGGIFGSGGTVTVNGGTVNATSGAVGYGGAGIGGGIFGSGGTVTVNGGTVNATGSGRGAGIGGSYGGAGGEVTISGGTVNATGGGMGAGIGGGVGKGGGNVTVSGGTVTAIAGVYDDDLGGEAPQAIGHGQVIADDDGSSIAFHDDAVVFTSALSLTPVTGTEREGACHGAWARIVPGSGGVPYLDPTDEGEPDKTCLNYAPYTGQATLTSGWYVVSGDITNDTRIVVSGDVHLILCDGTTMTLDKGITLTATNSLTIWGQMEQEGVTFGKLFAGTQEAPAPTLCAGIGGADCSDSWTEMERSDCGTLTVNGGIVEAHGGSGGAGIGGGGGLGGLNGGGGGIVHINCGQVYARGGEHSAGIGAGDCGRGGTVVITGGDVSAIGGSYAAGIGGACVDWQGNTTGGNVTILGGTVTAVCGGGRAEAIGKGTTNDASSPSGSLDFPDTYCAYSPETATTPVDAANRMAACRGNRVKLTRCDPHGAAYRNNGADHTAHCPYCGAEGATEAHVFEDGVCACGALEPGVTDVRAEPGAPGSGTVTISFNVTNSPAAVCPGWNAPFLSIVATDNLTGSNYVSAASALSGDTDAADGPHTVTWDFKAQGIDFASTNVTFTVAYLRMPDWCVIDLSGGKDAAHYPVTYVSNVPKVSNVPNVPGVTFNADAYKTTNLVMRLIGPGTFKMGGTTETEITNAFYCAVFETTQRQWELVTGARPSNFKNETCYATRPVEKVSWNMIRGDAATYDWPNVQGVASDSIVGVLRQKTGLAALDLPTEAQWEYACRAGTTSTYNNGGDTEDDLQALGRYSNNGGSGSSDSCATDHGTAAVGSYLPNAWGLYDMHGNVWEWCLERYSSSGSSRVKRGGGWSSSAYGCTSSFRGSSTPSHSNLNDGFRLVRTLSNNFESERSAEAAAGAERAGTVCAGTSAPIAVGMREFADTDIKLTPYDAPYDGQPHTIGVETNEAIAGLELKFCAIEAATGGTFDIRQSTSAPPEYTNVCDMVVFVEASAPGYFTKTNSAAVKITPRSIADAAIAPIPVQYYEGAALTPAVSVQIGGLRPAEGTDYTASYAANDAPGTGTVTLTGKGNYTNETSATFQILAAPRSLAVTAGQWGRVAVVVDGATNWIAAGAADVPVGYGSSVTVAAVPDAGFAAGPAGDLSFASYTENTNLVFAFVPNPAAELRWKYSSAVGRYFAQVAIPAHAGYDEALGGLAFLFADRTNAVGEVYAQLWNAAARGPQGVLVTDGGVAYRGVALGEAAFAGKAENARVLWGVADASFLETRNIVPAGERQIGLYVRKRVNPVSGNETAAEVENFLGYLTWTTDGTRWFLPVVEGGAATSPAPAARNAAAQNAPQRRAYAPATLNAALALGLGAEAVADNPPKARIAAFTVGADGAVSGRVEAVAGGEASSRFGAATVRILAAEALGGPWREVRAEVDPATGAFALPAGAVEGRFFRAEVETRAMLE